MSLRSTASIALVLLMISAIDGYSEVARETTQANVSIEGDSSAAIRDERLDSAWHDPGPDAYPAPDAISAFVRRIFQDSRGDLWFGTNGDGVVRYNGDSLEYFAIDDGFGGVAVRGIVEDKKGNIWFGTEGGITRYDGKSFINFSEKDGLINTDVWAILIDSKGTFWIGTLQGVSRFDGETFVPFPIPAAAIENTDFVLSPGRVSCITEDRQGHIWFGTDGAGAYRYDGKLFSHFSTREGLSDNNVSCILQDSRGTYWFSTMFGGVTTFDGKTFTNVSEKEKLSGIEVWNVYEDQLGNIWFPAEHAGLYRYDGKSFANFYKKQGLDGGAIQCTFQDREGRLWAGGYLGLYRLEGGTFVRVARGGPWQ